MSTTYRIEQRSREGQILRAVYVDDDGRPLSLRAALAGVVELRPQATRLHKVGGSELVIVDNNTGRKIDEEAERRPWWLKDRGGNVAASMFEAAVMLEELAHALRAGGDQPTPDLQLTVGLFANIYGPDDLDDARCDQVDLLAGVTGQETQQTGGSYETVGHFVKVHAYAARAEPKPVDEPETPELVDGRENPETGDPVPDGIEGHPVGRVVEQTARAALRPDALTGDDGSLDVQERRCIHCGQPWALIISGNARHPGNCPEVNVPAEAGETEDALNVPGLTDSEADDFMSGGAR